mmetsp:Transcript_20859/g.58857  ORF Transcript_20859/g.58857 Transcript_20859/m.58857 type:complete len:261 (-) Transcript_20859:872-1654(-)
MKPSSETVNMAASSRTCSVKTLFFSNSAFFIADSTKMPVITFIIARVMKAMYKVKAIAIHGEIGMSGRTKLSQSTPPRNASYKVSMDRDKLPHHSTSSESSCRPSSTRASLYEVVIWVKTMPMMYMTISSITTAPNSDRSDLYIALVTTFSSLKNWSRRSMRKMRSSLSSRRSRTKAAFFMVEAVSRAGMFWKRISTKTSPSCRDTRIVSKTFQRQAGTQKNLDRNFASFHMSSNVKIAQKTVSDTMKNIGSVSVLFLAM